MMNVSAPNFRLELIKKTDKIGVFLSGGTDSALMLYYLRRETDNEIYPITVPKHDGAVNYIGNIIHWVETKLDKKIESPIIIGNPNLYHAHILGDAIHKCFNHNLCDIYYVGDNTYPADILPNGPSRMKVKNQKVIYPLFDIYKTDILSTYVKLNILELLEFTHSCTAQSIGRCNNCWQCRERNWAFEQLNMIDVGTL
jgi:hypothetical protein